MCAFERSVQRGEYTVTRIYCTAVKLYGLKLNCVQLYMKFYIL